MLLLGLIIVLLAQANITINYNKYKKISVHNKITGSEVARMILSANGLDNIYVVETQGDLTDHYDPKRKVIRLSYDIYHGESIAALSVAAHECGHAIQDKENYSFFRMRSMLVPIVNLISYLGYVGLIIALFVSVVGYIKISIGILFATIVFQLVTLPVEFDASKRGKEQLKILNLIDDDEAEGCRKMLFAAALTYVAGLLSNLLQLLRLIMILGYNRRD